MVQVENVKGFSDFMSKVKTLVDQGKRILCMFCGDKDASGNSWCPDCVEKEPVVRKSLENFSDQDDLVFLYCAVGGRDYWKDKSNDFRVHNDLKLTGVPTLMMWGKPSQKLVESQISSDSIPLLVED